MLTERIVADSNAERRQAAKAQAAAAMSPSEREGASESAWGGAPGAVENVGPAAK